MNYWAQLSIEYANQRSYLDDLFQVYPTIPGGIREIDDGIWDNVEEAFNEKNNIDLIKQLCLLEKFPIKDSYVAFLKLDSNSFERNPQTINRLAGIIYEMGLKKLRHKCIEPKETNTQIGPMFKRWIEKKSLGIEPIPTADFLSTSSNAILKGRDAELNNFAREHCDYVKNKGLDFVARFNGKYVLGETKFITAIGGNQSNSFTDVITTLTTPVKNAICIGILDGIPWLTGKSPYYTQIVDTYKDYNIMSALVLRNFLYQL